MTSSWNNEKDLSINCCHAKCICLNIQPQQTLQAKYKPRFITGRYLFCILVLILVGIAQISYYIVRTRQHTLAPESTLLVVPPEPMSNGPTDELGNSIVDGQVEATTLPTWTFIGFKNKSCTTGVINLSVSDNKERCLSLSLSSGGSILATTFRDAPSSDTWGVCGYYGAVCTYRADQTARVPQACRERNLLEASVKIKKKGQNC
jgi:hypothetical protein